MQHASSSTEWISLVAHMHNRLVAVLRGNTRLMRIQAQMVRRNTCAKNNNAAAMRSLKLYSLLPNGLINGAWYVF